MAYPDSVKQSTTTLNDFIQQLQIGLGHFNANSPETIRAFFSNYGQGITESNAQLFNKVIHNFNILEKCLSPNQKIVVIDFLTIMANHIGQTAASHLKVPKDVQTSYILNGLDKAYDMLQSLLPHLNLHEAIKSENYDSIINHPDVSPRLLSSMANLIFYFKYNYLRTISEDKSYTQIYLEMTDKEIQLIYKYFALHLASHLANLPRDTLEAQQTDPFYYTSRELTCINPILFGLKDLDLKQKALNTIERGLTISENIKDLFWQIQFNSQIAEARISANPHDPLALQKALRAVELVESTKNITDKGSNFYEHVLGFNAYVSLMKVYQAQGKFDQLMDIGEKEIFGRSQLAKPNQLKAAADMLLGCYQQQMRLLAAQDNINMAAEYARKIINFDNRWLDNGILDAAQDIMRQYEAFSYSAPRH